MVRRKRHRIRRVVASEFLYFYCITHSLFVILSAAKNLPSTFIIPCLFPDLTFQTHGASSSLLGSNQKTMNNELMISVPSLDTSVLNFGHSSFGFFCPPSSDLIGLCQNFNRMPDHAIAYMLYLHLAGGAFGQYIFDL